MSTSRSREARFELYSLESYMKMDEYRVVLDFSAHGFTQAGDDRRFRVIITPPVGSYCGAVGRTLIEALQEVETELKRRMFT